MYMYRELQYSSKGFSTFQIPSQRNRQRVKTKKIKILQPIVGTQACGNAGFTLCQRQAKYRMSVKTVGGGCGVFLVLPLQIKDDVIKGGGASF